MFFERVFHSGYPVISSQPKVTSLHSRSHFVTVSFSHPNPLCPQADVVDALVDRWLIVFQNLAVENLKATEILA